VATAVVLLPATHREPWLQPAATMALARLGVTGIAVVRDARSLGLVVEGWAFDPSRSAEALLEALGAKCGTRTLYPVLEIAVSPAAPPASPASSRKEERNASVLGDSDCY
jgi:hypothetical protein